MAGGGSVLLPGYVAAELRGGAAAPRGGWSAQVGAALRQGDVAAVEFVAAVRVQARWRSSLPSPLRVGVQAQWSTGVPRCHRRFTFFVFLYL